MSITKLRNNSARYMKVGLWLFVIIFVASIPFWNSGTGSRTNNKLEQSNDVIATVNGKDIKNGDFLERYTAQKEMYKKVGGMNAIQDAQLRGEILSQLINEQIVISAAEKKGISVGWGELRRERNKLIDARVDQEKQIAGGKGRKLTDNEFDRLLRQSSPSKTLGQFRKEIANELTKDKVRNYIMINKLEAQLKSSVGNIDDQRLTDNFRQLKVSHIVILSNKAPEQAQRKAEEVQKKLKAGEDFAKMAAQFSDDPTSKSKGGDLGFMPVAGDKDLQGLKVGQTSGIIKLPYGYRIVKVEDSKLELPKDFDKNKNKYRDQLTSQLQSEALREFFDTAQKSAKIEVRNPEFNGYWIARKAMNSMDMDERTKLFKQALQSLDKATKDENSDNSSLLPAYAEKVVIYQMTGEGKKAIDVLVDIMDNKQLTDTPELRMMLAELYIQNGEKEKAVPNLKIASEEAYDAQTHVRLKSMYESIGHPELAAVETKWMKANPELMSKLNNASKENAPIKLKK
ncbi:MAG: peptidylprolyl isomerase [Armatimonadota bacterium]